MCEMQCDCKSSRLQSRIDHEQIVGNKFFDMGPLQTSMDLNLSSNEASLESPNEDFF